MAALLRNCSSFPEMNITNLFFEAVAIFFDAGFSISTPIDNSRVITYIVLAGVGDDLYQVLIPEKLNIYSH